MRPASQQSKAKILLLTRYVEQTTAIVELYLYVPSTLCSSHNNIEDTYC